jgi:FkbM family methyltransferase
MSIQVSQRTPTAERPWRIRAVHVALLVCLPALATVPVVQNWRPIRFWATGRVSAEGATFYLQPDDKYLTQVVVKYGEYEPTETRLIRQVLGEGDTFIDVGANVGWYSVLAAKRVGETGKVVAFEPEPSSLETLRRNVRLNGLNNVVVEGKALSNAGGTFKLFLAKANLGMHSLVLNHGGEHYVEVEAVRFDDYWRGRGPVRLIKIDTEGAEAMILDGMRETLKSQKELGLIVEFAPWRWKKSGYDADRVLEGLYRLGFKASHIDESAKKVVYLGAPRVKDLNFPEGEDHAAPSLYLTR